MTPAQPETITVVLADDHDLVRSGLKLLLQGMQGVRIVGEARNGRELVSAAQSLKPQLVITDISMPELDGISALELIRRELPGTRMLVVSMYDSVDFIRRAMQAGADGYLMKDAPPFELEQAVRSVAMGRGYYSPDVSRRLLQAREQPQNPALTTRQVEILTMIGRGLATKEIAFELGLSPKTVDVHRARIMERLGINDIAGLTLYCVRHGLVDPNAPERR